MVECDLAKVEVAGSNPVSRSNFDDIASQDTREVVGAASARQRNPLRTPGAGGHCIPPAGHGRRVLSAVLVRSGQDQRSPVKM